MQMNDFLFAGSLTKKFYLYENFALKKLYACMYDYRP